jgi:hypothetical protein
MMNQTIHLLLQCSIRGQVCGLLVVLACRGLLVLELVLLLQLGLLLGFHALCAAWSFMSLHC